MKHSSPGIQSARGQSRGPREQSRGRLTEVFSSTAVLGISLLLWVASLGGVGCRRQVAAPSPPPPALGSIEVQQVSARNHNPGGVDESAVAAVIRRALLSSGLVATEPPDGGSPGGPRLRVRVTVASEVVEAESKGVVRAAVGLRLDTRPSDAPGAVEQELSAAGEQFYAVTAQVDRGALAQRLVERTAGDLVAGFVARARLRTAAGAEIHRAITGDAGSPGLREEAIRVAGARGLREEVPTLLALLQNEQESVRDAALGALIALREQRAVAELTRNRSLRDRHEMRKILEAISILGGEEARDYLSFVAESHDDEEIRTLAAEARVRMERRRDR